MKVTVIGSNIYSNYFNNYMRIELAYPLRTYESALTMFKREYPKCTNRLMFTSYEFDSDDRPDLYNAFKNAGCIRTYKTY